MEFIDLKSQYNYLKEDINGAIQKVLDDNQFIMGNEVFELEKKLKDYVRADYCITCANGTDALYMLFMAYEIGEGDVVFTSDIAFIASVEPAVMLGAVPVFCDINEDNYNISPISLEKQINAVISEGKYTPKAVVVVYFLGNPADI